MKKLIATILALSIVVSTLSVTAFAENSETYTYIKGDGNEHINNDNKSYRTLSVYSFHDGMATTMSFSKNGRPQYGVIDRTGKTIVPTKYDEINDFCDGLACVSIMGKGRGYIDKTGKEVIPLNYALASSFNDGYAFVSTGGDTGYIDKTGKEIVPIGKYDDYITLGDGIIVTCQEDIDENVVYTMMDIDGKVICTLPYSISIFEDGLATIHDNNKYGLINKMGEIILPPKYNYIGSFYDGLAEVCIEGKGRKMKYGFIDKTGKEIVPVKYDHVSNFSEGLAYTSISKKGSYINTAGKEVIKLDCDDAYNFHDGIAVVGKLDKKHKMRYGYIDKTGKKITELIYNKANMSIDGRARVERNGKCGFIDTTGKEVIPVTYYNVLNFSEGLAMVGNKNAKGVVTYSFVDKDGKVVIPNIAVSPKTTGLDWFHELFQENDNENDKDFEKIEVPGTNNWSDFFKDLFKDLLGDDDDDDDDVVIIDDPVLFAR